MASDLSWAEGVVDSLAESTGYRLNKRQVRALAILSDARLRIRGTFKVGDHATAFRSVLHGFLRGARLQPPFNIRPGVNEVVRSAASAYRSAVAWEQAVASGDAKAAGHYAYQVSEFLSYIDYSVMTVYLLRDYENGRRRFFGGRGNKKRFESVHAEWLRIARDVQETNRFARTKLAVCRIVAHRAGKNPKTGKPYNPDRVYRAIGDQLKNIQR